MRLTSSLSIEESRLDESSDLGGGAFIHATEASFASLYGVEIISPRRCRLGLVAFSAAQSSSDPLPCIIAHAPSLSPSFSAPSEAYFPGPLTLRLLYFQRSRRPPRLLLA